MHDLAELYHEQGKYKQAEKLVHKALVIREQLLGPDHSDVARSLTTLAKLHFSLGRCVVCVCMCAVLVWCVCVCVCVCGAFCALCCDTSLV